MLFVIIDYISKKNNKIIFWVWFILYLMDIMVFLYVLDFLNILSHMVALKLLHDSKTKQN